MVKRCIIQSCGQTNGLYRNLKIVYNIDVQDFLLFFDFAKALCVRDTDILQCFKCFKYGHIAAYFSEKAAYKFSGDEHNSKECDELVYCSKCVLIVSTQHKTLTIRLQVAT